MVRSIERYHEYRYCPRCKADVEAHYRFCRQCTFWLAKPTRDGLRQINVHKDDPGIFARVLPVFWGAGISVHYLIVGLGLAMGLTVLLVLYFQFLLPNWGKFGPQAHQRACYANLRVIQGAIEAYVQENRFTPLLASDPVKTLFDSGFLRNQPHCPERENRYAIPRGSSLQCIGSEGHGLP